jgi:undecaprenyl-diphosphatase
VRAVLLLFAFFFSPGALWALPPSPSEAALLGLVQGAAEFFPISSSAHLLLLEECLGVPMGDEEAGNHPSHGAFHCLLELASIATIIFAYWRRMGQMLLGLLGRSAEGLRLLILLCLAFLPTAALGAFLPVAPPGIRGLALPMALGGVYLLLCERVLGGRGTRSLGEMGIADALLIGSLQLVALFPGVSRSLMTLSAGLLLGFSAPVAVEFSFLLGLGTALAGSCYRLAGGGWVVLLSWPLAPIAVGCGCAFLCSALFLFPALCWLSHRSLRPFAYYRLLLGSLLLIFF